MYSFFWHSIGPDSRALTDSSGVLGGRCPHRKSITTPARLGTCSQPSLLLLTSINEWDRRLTLGGRSPSQTISLPWLIDTEAALRSAVPTDSRGCLSQGRPLIKQSSRESAPMNSLLHQLRAGISPLCLATDFFDLISHPPSYYPRP